MGVARVWMMYACSRHRRNTDGGAAVGVPPRQPASVPAARRHFATALAFSTAHAG